MKKLALAVAIVSLGAVALITTAIAKNSHGGGNGHSFSTKLTGFEEVIPASATAGEGGAVSTTGHGRLSLKVRDNPLRIEYRFRYDDLEGTDTLFAHIHFGQLATNGGISAFLCDSDPANNATLPDCTNTEGDITGTIDAAEVIGPAGQGIEAGNIAELIRAMRHGVTYANLHTNKWPSGEIRGQIDNGRHFGFFRGKGKHKRGGN